MSNEPKTVIGYKFAHAIVCRTRIIDVIITLEIPLENNAHNMNRSSIVNKQFAQMRCHYAKVLNIEDYDSGKSLPAIAINKCYSHYDKTFTYKKGEIVSVSFVEFDIESVCGVGIHFFLSKEAVYHYGYVLGHAKLQTNSETPIVIKEFNEDGRLLTSCEYLNNVRHGNYYYWYSGLNNKIFTFEGTYNNEKRVGIFPLHVNNVLTFTFDYADENNVTITIYNDDEITKYAEMTSPLNIVFFDKKDCMTVININRKFEVVPKSNFFIPKPFQKNAQSIILDKYNYLNYLWRILDKYEKSYIYNLNNALSNNVIVITHNSVDYSVNFDNNLDSDSSCPANSNNQTTNPSCPANSNNQTTKPSCPVNSNNQTTKPYSTTVIPSAFSNITTSYAAAPFPISHVANSYAVTPYTIPYSPTQYPAFP